MLAALSYALTAGNVIVPALQVGKLRLRDLSTLLRFTGMFGVQLELGPGSAQPPYAVLGPALPPAPMLPRPQAGSVTLFKLLLNSVQIQLLRSLPPTGAATPWGCFESL